VEAWKFQERHKEQISIHLQGVNIEVVWHSRDFLAKLPEAEACVVWYFRSEWLKKADKLKLITTPAAGTDWIEVESRENFRVWHGGFHGPLMAESVVGAALYFCKAFGPSREYQERKKWARVKISQKITSLYEARVTLLGFGKIGQVIARKLKPFGCRITGVKRRMIDRPKFFTSRDRVVTADQLKEVLTETDHLIVVLPGGESTDGLLTAGHFQCLPRSSYFYNVGRGNVVTEEILVNALQNNSISGAYLDVFSTEPLPETSPLWEMDQVLIQPHLSAASPQYLDLYFDELIDRLKREGLG
jgi:phosphoglycerate dehydrogenase-like enzyme